MSRPRGGQVGERGGDEGGVAAGQRGQPDVAGGGAGERGELGFGGGQLGGDRVGAGHQRPAGLGERDAAAVAGDQPDAGFGLQPVDVVADRGLAVAEFAGGGGQRAVLRDRAQHKKPPDIQHGSHRHTLRTARTPQDGVFRR